MSAIVVKNLVKEYGSVRALNGISLTVEEGEFFCLLGPNGAGKTTFIKVITGQTRGRGHVRVLGVDPMRDPVEVRRRTGIVPETESVPTYLTPWEYLYLVCRIRGVEDAEDRVERYIREFDLREYEDRLCKELSKGTRQRLMIAAAFIHDPPLAVLDEPFINLDPLYQRKFSRYFLKKVDEGTTLLMCTHIIEIAQKLCRRFAVIYRGQVRAMIEDGEDVESAFLRAVGYDAEDLSD